MMGTETMMGIGQAVGKLSGVLVRAYTGLSQQAGSEVRVSERARRIYAVSCPVSSLRGDEGADEERLIKSLLLFSRTFSKLPMPSPLSPRPKIWLAPASSTA